MTGGERDRLGAVGVAVLVSFLFSLTLGLWFSSVVGQSADRADLIAQLESTRTELAAAERAAGAAQVQASMARDIHETLAQGFTSVVMLAQTAASDLDRGDPEAARQAKTTSTAYSGRTAISESKARARA